MANNTIQLKLLENKYVVAEINGKNYAYEGGYYIVAGSKGDTFYEIVSIPADYADYTISIEMINAQGMPVPKDKIKIMNNRRFNLPDEMAVAGYGSITIKAVKNAVEAVWFPLKVKVWNNDWKQGAHAPALITVGEIETLPASGKAYVDNVGNDKYVILNMGIPSGYKGDSGVMAATAAMFTLYTDYSTGKIYCRYIDTGTGQAPKFRFNKQTGKLYYLL